MKMLLNKFSDAGKIFIIFRKSPNFSTFTDLLRSESVNLGIYGVVWSINQHKNYFEFHEFYAKTHKFNEKRKKLGKKAALCVDLYWHKKKHKNMGRFFHSGTF